LAVAMGQLNRVLLIDADLRRATLDQTFEFAPGTPGLANLIGGNAKLDDCIRSVGNVDMISAGTVPSNPLELLSSPRFAKLLEARSEEHTSELQSRENLVCRLLLEKKNI